MTEAHEEMMKRIDFSTQQKGRGYRFLRFITHPFRENGPKQSAEANTDLPERVCGRCGRVHGKDGWNPRHIPLYNREPGKGSADKIVRAKTPSELTISQVAEHISRQPGVESVSLGGSMFDRIVHDMAVRNLTLPLEHPGHIGAAGSGCRGCKFEDWMRDRCIHCLRKDTGIVREGYCSNQSQCAQATQLLAEAFRKGQRVHCDRCTASNRMVARGGLPSHHEKCPHHPFYGRPQANGGLAHSGRGRTSHELEAEVNTPINLTHPERNDNE